VERKLKKLARRRGLDYFSSVHHGYPVAKIADHRKVVRDENDRKSEPLPQGVKQVDYLRLHRHVKGGDGLVGNYHLGACQYRARYADALALTARKFVRISACKIGGKTDERERFRHPFAQFLFRKRSPHGKPLTHAFAHRHSRIERRGRVLEDHLDIAAVAPLRQPFAVEKNLALGLVKPYHASSESGLSAPRFTDEPEYLARVYRKAYAVDGVKAAFALAKALAQVVYA
jgi:hypothetical protein